MRAKSALSLSARAQCPSKAKAAVSGEIVTVLAPGEAKLPRRHAGSAQDREAQFVALLQLLTGEGAALDALD